jgi:RHS repeat-associated protein
VHRAANGLCQTIKRFGLRIDPYINRWIQPDPIVPDLYNPQDLNRFSYTRDNPVRYTDPSGHCIWDSCNLEVILIGVGIGPIVDYGLQVRQNMKTEGMSFWDAVYYKNIDESSMASAGVGGGVGAATISILAPATVLQALAAGGLAGRLSGRASALTRATWSMLRRRF